MDFEFIIKEIIFRVKKKYGITLVDTDIYICPDTKVHLCTTKLAKLFRVTYHQFTNKYVRPLMDSGVDRIIIGGVKYYNLEHIEERYRSLLAGDKDIFAVCAEMTDSKSKSKVKKK